MIFNTNIELGRPFGIPVKLDFTLLLLAAMFVFRAGGGLFGMLAHGLVALVALLAAILVHELGHALVAMSFGGKVREITLMFFGGIATIYNEPRDPWRQAAIALAGPGAGFALWFAALRVLAFLPRVALLQDFFGVVAIYSLYLSIFNMIPAYPMDGGRVLRAILATFIGRIKAARISCQIARVLAVCMGLYGLFHFDLFLIMIAFFVWAQASSELTMLDHFRGADDDDDTVIISPPPFGGDNDYTKINRER